MNHLFFVSFCFGQSVSAKGIFSLASVKIPFVFFVRVFVEFFPLAVEILFFLKQAARPSSQGQYHTRLKKKKKNTPWKKKKIKVLPLRHTMRDDDDDHTDDVNLHLKLTACAITQSR